MGIALDPRSLALRFIGFTGPLANYSQLLSTTQIGLATTLLLNILTELYSILGQPSKMQIATITVIFILTVAIMFLVYFNHLSLQKDELQEQFCTHI